VVSCQASETLWDRKRRYAYIGLGNDLRHEVDVVLSAPGFQTGVRRVRVTPEIAARIRRGEDVSPAEIEAASRKADLEEEERKHSGLSASATSNSNGNGGMSLPRGVLEERDDRHLINSDSDAKEETNEWLPDSITKPTKRKKGRR